MASPWPTPQPAVLAAITVLSEALEPILVSHTVPHTRPPMFVRVSRIGGGQPSPVSDIARILIECCAPGIATAENMANTARAALRNAGGTIVGGAYIRAFSNEQGPVDFPDPDVSDMVRYQFFGDLTLSTRAVDVGS